MRVVHKIKEIKPKGEFQLLNGDGSWNIYCNSRTSDILANWHWQFVTCKACLKYQQGDDKE